MAAERAGIVTDLTAPEAGKKQGYAKVGGRKVWFFWNDYGSENPTQVRQRLEKAQREAFPVLATGEERPNPQSREHPIFTAKGIERVPAQNGPQAPQNGSPITPPVEKKHFVGRDPGVADFWLATRWAWSLAAELLGKLGKEPSVSAISELAGEIFQGSYAEALKHHEWAAGLEEEA